MPTRFTLYAFGSNGTGQLGIGSTQDKIHPPYRVPDPPPRPYEGIKSIRGGSGHTLILTDSGTVWGSGRHVDGRLGCYAVRRNGNTTHSDSSTTLVLFEKIYEGISFIAVTESTSGYILNPNTKYNETNNALLYTEGMGSHGEHGRGKFISNSCYGKEATPYPKVDQFRPTPVVRMSFPGAVVDFAAGLWHFIAVLDNGEVWGWGKNRHHQLGQFESTDERTVDVWIPMKLPGISFSVRRAVCGKDFTYLVGDPDKGEHMVLGDDPNGVDSDKPTDVKGWKDIGASWGTIFVLFNDGALRGWGKSNQWVPVPENLPPIDKIAVGSEHILALTSNGNRLISWGWGFHGNCGDLRKFPIEPPHGFISNTWIEITEIPGHRDDIRMIAAGHSTSFVLTAEYESEVVGELDSQSDIDAEENVADAIGPRHGQVSPMAGKGDSETLKETEQR
ncbi:RCC1/BLIP-II [Lojkania enalia]|uniref:RCC1/BLIP-II n=1 Tax=Lojkania enalia TaxID=147567 RepID=A0A9P4K7Y2_9PLEO|nr:RCC1/BLIP-II [Didymosphaeria enalia]